MAKRKPKRSKPTPKAIAPGSAPKLFAITEGTVIDHLPGGHALQVLQMLGVREGTSRMISVGMNLGSRKMGRKDIVKVEGRLLTKDELNRLAMIAPGATINQISSGKVKEKFSVELPAILVGAAQCPNPNCVTSNQKVPGKFLTLQKQPPK